MGKVYDGIDARQREWIARQAMFFVGSAPLAGDGHVNVSPKGPIGSLRVLDENTVAYLDVIGSGAETIAHLRENGRIVIMLCAFEEPAIPESRRAVVLVDVTRVADSCGYGVPLMRFAGPRPHAAKSAAKRLRVGGEQAFVDYQRERNARSLDGLPAVEPGVTEPA